MEIKRAELIGQLAEVFGYTKASAAELVDDFTAIIIENLERGNTVSLRNLGKFGILERAQRRCPNPQSGEEMVIPAHYIPRFYPSQRMRLAVKKWEDNEKRGLG